MNCRKNQVSCLSSGYSCAYGLKVTHLSHKDNIRILTKSCTKSTCIVVGVRSDLTLVNDGHPVLICELNRVLQCDNMGFPVVVYLIDYRCKGCGLTTSGRTCNQHQTSLFLVKVNYCVRNTKDLCTWNGGGNNPKCQGIGTPLFEDIKSVSSYMGNREGHIVLSVFIELFPLFFRHDLFNDGKSIWWQHLAIFLHGDELPIKSHLGWESYCYVNVRCSCFLCFF